MQIQEEGFEAALRCTGEQVQGQVLRVERCHSAAARISSRPTQQPAAVLGHQPSLASPAPKVVLACLNGSALSSSAQIYLYCAVHIMV